MRLKLPLPASHRRRILRLAVVVAAAVICTLSWQAARAQNVIHIVQPGENLFRIGLRYGVGWVAIMSANGLSSTTIYVGQQLIIPGGDPLAAGPLPDSAAGVVAAACDTGMVNRLWVETDGNLPLPDSHRLHAVAGDSSDG